jgi:hypothetical protein
MSRYGGRSAHPQRDSRPDLLPASSSLRRIERIMPQLLGAMPPIGSSVSPRFPSGP